MTQTPNPDFTAWTEPNGHAMHGFSSHLHDHNELAKNIAIYYGMVSCMDKYIGVILDKLEALGLAENTLIVFTSDHGHFYGQHGLIAKGPFHYEDVIRVPFIVRQPGRVPAGLQSDALQSLADLAPSFLSACGLDIPADMTGVDQTPVWYGQADRVRDAVIVENRHQPTTIHARTYVDDRFKLTIYRYRPYGEFFDLVSDPGEIHNRWDDPAYAGLKAEVMYKMLLAEIAKEEPLTESSRYLPQKSEAMYTRECFDGIRKIVVDPVSDRYELCFWQRNADFTPNAWDDPAAQQAKAEMVMELLFARLAAEPMWMPRIDGA
jgi:arylsulfatase A-like enzyme